MKKTFIYVSNLKRLPKDRQLIQYIMLRQSALLRAILSKVTQNNHIIFNNGALRFQDSILLPLRNHFKAIMSTYFIYWQTAHEKQKTLALLLLAAMKASVSKRVFSH